MQKVTGDNVQIAYVDAGYTGEQAAGAAEEEGIRLEVVKLPDAKRGFVVAGENTLYFRCFLVLILTCLIRSCSFLSR